MSEQQRLALEVLGVAVFAGGLALVVSLLDVRAAVGVAFVVVGLYCALAANVYSGANANESGTRTGSTSDPAQRR